MEDDLIERDSENESEERSDVSLSVDASETDEERGVRKKLAKIKKTLEITT